MSEEQRSAENSCSESSKDEAQKEEITTRELMAMMMQLVEAFGPDERSKLEPGEHDMYLTEIKDMCDAGEVSQFCEGVLTTYHKIKNDEPHPSFYVIQWGSRDPWRMFKDNLMSPLTCIKLVEKVESVGGSVSNQSETWLEGLAYLKSKKQ